jgi:hypothetical protein
MKDAGSQYKHNYKKKKNSFMFRLYTVFFSLDIEKKKKKT